ncbi:MAG: type I-E CRISPR-associated protein Cse2/CasB [Candidatus Omnitrophota bacterium]
MSESFTVKKKRGEQFVDFVISRIQIDNAFRAALSRSDNPATEYQAWEYLAHWCDLGKEWERRPIATIAAAVAVEKPLKDGYSGIGKAIASCYDDRDQAKTKFRRLLACDSVNETCKILRPLLRLIALKAKKTLSYGKLLNELLYFGDGEKIKVQWANDFYGRRNNDSDYSEIDQK